MPELSGPLAQHMALHVVAMNIVAPVLMLLWRPGGRAAVAQLLGPASALQLLLLYAWHVPAALTFATASRTGAILMHASLFLAAMLFWRCVIDAAANHAWRALAALLLAAKLFCLMGVLLTFAPRPLYLEAFALCLPVPAVTPLADQQTAGLLMLVACPLAYISAGIAIAARWLAAIERLPPAAVRELVRHD